MKANQDKAPAELAALACSPALAGLIEQLEAAGRQAMIFTDTDIETIRERWFGKAAAYRDAASMARQCQASLECSHGPNQKQ